jgi:hypothetical protein
MRRVVLLLFLGCMGCAGALRSASHDVTTSAVQAATDASARAAWSGVVTSMTTAARDVVLSQETTTRTQALAAAVVASLGPRAQQVVRAALDEALGPRTQAEVDALRERLAGAPLRVDLADLLAELVAQLQKEGPALATDLQPVAKVVAGESHAVTRDVTAMVIAIVAAIVAGACVVHAVYLHRQVQQIKEGAR